MTTRITLALDQSLRTKDEDGRLHVKWTNISKATVNPYYGREIPGYEKLRLDPDRVYQLWRHPEELAKAAPTFNGIQLMSAHLGVDTSGGMKEQVAGALGNDAEFRPPYLGNSLTIWWQEDIDDIESGKKCQISCGYYYDPDMTPGEIEGLRYDGIMRNIRANHVALVEAGRAGPDVIVHDSKDGHRMPALASRKALIVKGGLAAYLRPKLAAGTSMLALDAALAPVTRKNWQSEKARVLAEITALATPKLAKDAKLDDLKLALDMMDEAEDGEAEDDEIDGMDESEGGSEEKREERMAMEKRARDKKARDRKAKDRKARDMKAKDKSEDEDEEDEAEDEELSESEREEKKEARDRRAKDRKARDGKAMDAAIAKATTNVLTRMNAAIEAREIVRPLVGNVSLALDSAEAIFKAALDLRKIPTAGVPPEAYRAMVGMLPRPGASPMPRTLAMDSADDGGLDVMFPNLSRINQA